MRERQRAVRSDLVVIDVEGPWLDFVRSAGIRATRDELLMAGVGPTKSAAMAVWLDDQASQNRVVSPPTARTYRHILRQLKPPDRRQKVSQLPNRAIPG